MTTRANRTRRVVIGRGDLARFIGAAFIAGATVALLFS